MAALAGQKRHPLATRKVQTSTLRRQKPEERGLGRVFQVKWRDPDELYLMDAKGRPFEFFPMLDFYGGHGEFSLLFQLGMPLVLQKC